MSDYENHTGKLRLVVPNEGESTSDLRKRIYNEKYLENPNYDDDDYYEDYIEVKGNIYKVIEHYESYDDLDGCILNKNQDGTISFITRFYNGGTCFSEMIEEALTNFKD